MNRRDLLKTASALAFFAAPGLALSPPAFAEGVSASTGDYLLDKGWRFFEGDIAFPEILSQDDSYDNAKAGKAWGAAAASFDDSAWAEVQLPHDFVSFQPIDKTANRAQGYRKRGVAWYRNTLRFAAEDDGQYIELQLDGVATHATIWFNGNVVAHNWSGYNSINIDLTPFATYGEAFNTLAIRVDAHAMEGWWYEGGGLYRTARIVKRKPVHIITDGVFAHPVKTGGAWQIPVEVTAYNISKAAQAVTVIAALKDNQGRVLTEQHASATVASLDRQMTALTLDVADPKLWSVETPHLYQVHTRLMDGERLLDERITACGFRTTRFDKDKGFFLNDAPLKIQGVCLHQDHAGVGTAIPDSLWAYRLGRLKTMGCNAIRFTHNAVASSVLDLCDRMGFLVMAENRQFNPAPEYLAQLSWMVRRDRNHPSIYLWSVFNEEPMQGSEAGYEMVRRMAHAVKALDTTRPVTAAMNSGMFNPVNVSQAVDIVGFNYQQDQYDPFHAAHPDWPLMSSEDTSAFGTRGEYVTDESRHIIASYDDAERDWPTHRGSWRKIAERDFIAGGFVWAGFDYHGEPSPWGWPSNSSFYGIMDLCGFAKTAFYIHQAQWVKDRPVLAIAPHWNWPGQEGKPVKVRVCSNVEAVELRLNGASLGRQAVDKYEMNTWMVPYHPGKLEAWGYRGGQRVAKTHVETTGPAAALKITSDRAAIFGDGLDALPLTIEAVDAKGRSVPTAQNLVVFQIADGEILGLGNGDPNSAAPEKGDRRALFNGLAQVIVRANDGGAGALTLRAAAEGLKPAELVLPIAPKAAPVRQATTTSVLILDYWYQAPQAATPAAGLALFGKDMLAWPDFGPREWLKPEKADGYTLCSAHYTPHAKVQAKGGVIDFLSIAGVCDVYDGDHLLGRKTDPAPGFFSVPLPAGPGERRVNVLFNTKAGQAFGFSQNVRVRQA